MALANVASAILRFARRRSDAATERFNPSTLDRCQLNSSALNKAKTAALKKPLGLFDLVLTQILFVVGSSWVGAAAKLGQAHLFFWLLAILLFYIPQAAVVIYLSNRMPLEGGIYQWAKLAFNEFAGFIVAWNLWLLSITVIALGGMFVTTNISYAIGPGAAWMPDSKWCVSLISCAHWSSALGWACVRGLVVRQMGAQHRRASRCSSFTAALILLPFSRSRAAN